MPDLPLEVLVGITRLAEPRTASRLRETCKTLRAAIDGDLSIPWHADKLRWRFKQNDCCHYILFLLMRYGDVIRASPRGGAPFGGESHAMSTATIDELRAMDGTLQNIKIDLPGGAVQHIAGLKCIVSLRVTLGYFRGPITLFPGPPPDLPNLRSLTLRVQPPFSLPRGLTTLKLRALYNSFSIEPEVAVSLRVLRMSGTNCIGGPCDFAELLKNAPLLETLEMDVGCAANVAVKELRHHSNLRHVEMHIGRADVGEVVRMLPPLLKSLMLFCPDYRAPRNTYCMSAFETLNFGRFSGLRKLSILCAYLRRLNRIIWPPAVRHIDLTNNEIASFARVRFPISLRTLNITGNAVLNTPVYEGVEVTT